MWSSYDFPVNASMLKDRSVCVSRETHTHFMLTLTRKVSLKIELLNIQTTSKGTIFMCMALSLLLKIYNLFRKLCVGAIGGIFVQCGAEYSEKWWRLKQKLNTCS